MGKGSQQAPTDRTVRSHNLPEYADPYFRRMLQGAEDSTQPYQDNLDSPIYEDDLERPIYDDAGEITGYEQNITGFDQMSSYMPYQRERIASSDMYGDIMGSRAMTRGIAESGISGMPEAQATAQAGMDIQAEALGGLRGLANYDTGQFTAQSVDPYSKFQAADFSVADTSDFANEFQTFNPNQYSGFEKAQANSMMNEFQSVDPNSMMNEYQMANFSPSGEFDKYNFRDPSEFSNFGVRDDFTYSGFGFDPTRQFGTDEANRYMSPYMSAVVEDQKSQAIRDFERQGASRDAAAVQAGAFGGSRQAVQESLAEEALQDRLGSIGATGSQSGYQEAAQQFERDRAAQERQLGMEVGEFGRVQSGLASEQGRVDALRLQEQSQREFRQADEYARSGDMRAAEAARVQAANTAELARTQAGMAGEMGRTQAGRVSENARMDSMYQQEAARTQAARVNEQARLDDFLRMEMGRVQQSDAAENARMDSIMQQEAGRVQSGRVGELGRAQGLTVSELARVQGADAAEIARIQQSEAAELARTQGIDVSEAARIQQAREASRQFGAGQGLAAYQAIGSGASNLAGLGAGLAGLGERQRAADIQGAQLLETTGRDIRAEDQARLDMSYEDFVRQRDYPMSQYQKMAGILRGVPVTPDLDQQRFASYNPMQQALGAGISGLGLYKGLTS